MRSSDQSKAVFEQLRDTPAAGGATVRTLIENHDAWVHSTAVQVQVTAAVRQALARGPRPEETRRRIEAQKNALAALVTRLPVKLSHAG